MLGLDLTHTVVVSRRGHQCNNVRMNCVEETFIISRSRDREI